MDKNIHFYRKTDKIQIKKTRRVFQKSLGRFTHIEIHILPPLTWLTHTQSYSSTLCIHTLCGTAPFLAKLHSLSHTHRHFLSKPPHSHLLCDMQRWASV